jgi:hypothetical protein
MNRPTESCIPVSALHYARDLTCFEPLRDKTLYVRLYTTGVRWWASAGVAGLFE